MSGILLSSIPAGYTDLAYVSAAETAWVTDDSLTDTDTAEPAKDTVLPTAAQYQYQKEELSAFCHFGPNTFTGVEWGENYGTRPPGELFTLSQDFDADTMVRTLKEAGFQRLIVTAKHHDGFCIWASDETEYDVANTNYKNGEGDILAEISAACTEHDMDMGLYLSPWDIHEPSYGYYGENRTPLMGSNGQPANGKTMEEVIAIDKQYNGDYNEFYKNQLIEVLGDDKYGNAGKFVEVWMDGAKGSGTAIQNYTFEDWFEVIEENEPGCLLFGAESYTTVRWIGNENGIANEETWAQVKTNRANNTIDNNRSGTDRSTIGYPDGNQWTVPEADARITSGWFWGNGKKTPKTMEALANMYFNSVGHNAVLLLNVPPNNQGRVDDDILARVTEFGNAIKQTFGENFASGGTASASQVRGNDLTYKAGNVLDNNQDTYWTTNDGTSTGSLIIDLGEEKVFDVVSIEEAIRFGQRINSFTIQYRKNGGAWQTFATGTTIGSKRLARGKKVRADELKIEVTARAGKVPMITEVGAFKAVVDFEVKGLMPDGLTFLNNTDTSVYTYTGTWTKETGTHFAGDSSQWANANTNATMSMNFTGSKIYLMGTIDSGHGKAKIYIDNELVETINTQGSPRKTGQIIFTSDDLDPGAHTLRMELTESAIGFDGAYVINNGGKGMVGLEKDSYTMYENQTMQVVLNRVGGTVGEVSGILEPNPGSAIQDDFVTEPVPFTFKDGESQITVPVSTRRNTNTTGDQNFSIELTTPSEGLILGMKTTASVTIKDTESFDLTKLQALITEAEGKASGVYLNDTTAFKAALAEAKTVAENTEATALQIAEAYQDLAIAMEALIPRTELYSAEDPFYFPTTVDAREVLEAELGILENTGAADERWKLNVSTGDWASNGKFVNCLNSGDKVTYHFAARKGTYTVTATYRSGSTNNSLSWSGTNVAAGNNAAGNGNASETKTVSFDIQVTKSGYGTLIFTAPSGDSPQLDKLEIVMKSSDVNVAELAAAISEAKVKLADGNEYEQAGVDAVTAALAEAEVLLMSDTADQAAMDVAAADLRTKVAALVEVAGVVLDKAALEAAVAAAEEKLNDGKTYEEAGVTALEAALAEAETLLADEEASQEDLDALAAELQELTAALTEKASTPEKTEKPWIFTDVSDKDKSHWMYKAVHYVYNTTGKEGGSSLMADTGGSKKFEPGRNLDRAMLATILHRWAGEPAGNYPNKFTDVKSGYYVTAVLWANSKGIVNGKGGSSAYAPTDNVTRAEIAKMLYEYGVKHLGLTLSNSGDLSKFADANVVAGKWSEDYLKWATSVGIISGATKDGKYYLNPNNPATRAECAAMIQRFGDKYVK